MDGINKIGVQAGKQLAAIDRTENKGEQLNLDGINKINKIGEKAGKQFAAKDRTENKGEQLNLDGINGTGAIWGWVSHGGRQRAEED